MNLILSSIAIVLCMMLYGCGDGHMSEDLRPKSEVAFLNRVNDESAFGDNANAADRDAHIKAFNKYAGDSLKNITDWEMIVTNVNDDGLKASSTLSAYGMDGMPHYNVILAAPIKPYKGDPLTAGNEVEFTYSVLKEPNDTNLVKRIAFIKTLTSGDTVIVSGALTHLDSNKKLNFEELYTGGGWNVDLLATKFVKKNTSK